MSGDELYVLDSAQHVVWPYISKSVAEERRLKETNAKLIPPALHKMSTFGQLPAVNQQNLERPQSPKQDPTITVATVLLKNEKPQSNVPTSETAITIATAQGTRPHQQDEHCAVKIKQPCLTQFFSPEKAMARALDNTARQLSGQINLLPEAKSAGSTATVCVLYNKQIFTLHVGDSFALTTHSDSGAIKRLMRLHHPALSHENGRIFWGKGEVSTASTNKKTVHEVGKTGTGNIYYIPDQDQETQYGLSMSRAFGNVVLQKIGINSQPDIYISELDGSYNYLLLYTDGLREVMSDEEIVTFLRQNSTLSAEARLKALEEHATQLGCSDNTKIILCPINENMIHNDEAIVLGVFDGHDLQDPSEKSPPNNGAVIAQYLAKNFVEILQKNLESELQSQLLPELQDAIDIASREKNDAIRKKLEELRSCLIDDILTRKTEASTLQETHPFRQLGADTRTVLVEIFYTKKEYAQKINAVNKYRDKSLGVSKWHPQRYPVLICTIIGTLIGLIVGFIIGALVTPELFGMGGIPGAIAGGIEGGTIGAAIGGAVTNQCAKRLHYAYLNKDREDVRPEEACINAIDAVIQHHSGANFRKG